MKLHSGTRRMQPEEILPLTDKDDDADAGSKTDDDWNRYVLDDRSKTRRAQTHQDESRHQCCKLQAGYAVLGCDYRKHRNEGACRAGDLYPCSPEQTGAQSRYDCGVESLFRARP